jgi:hypothetical protein
LRAGGQAERSQPQGEHCCEGEVQSLSHVRNLVRRIAKGDCT